MFFTHNHRLVVNGPKEKLQGDRKQKSTYILTVVISLARTAEQFTAQEVTIIFQKGEVKIPEELHVFVLHSQLLWRVPVDHLMRTTEKAVTVK